MTAWLRLQQGLLLDVGLVPVERGFSKGHPREGRHPDGRHRGRPVKELLEHAMVRGC